MSRGVDLSTLSSLTDDATLAALATIGSSEHNTHRSGRRSLINNLLLAAQDAETLYAGSGEPTDKPQGKVYYDTATSLWMGYKTASGTPVGLADAALAYTLDFATAGTATFRAGGPLNVDDTQVALSTTGVLESYTLPGGTLARDLQTLEIIAWGTKTAANANASIQLRFNAGVQATHTIKSNSDEWRFDWFITRTGAATQKFCSACYQDRDDTALTDLVAVGTDAETLSGDLAIDLNLSSVNASDTISKEMFLIILHNY